jgi:hypothetical protein
MIPVSIPRIGRQWYRAAAKALGAKTVHEVTQVKKRIMSVAAKAKTSKATKLRWAKFRAEKNKKTKAA